MTQQGMLGGVINKAMGLQSLIDQQQAYQMRNQQMQLQQQQAEAKAAQDAQLQALQQQAIEGYQRGDMTGMISLIGKSPEVAGQIQKQLGIVDEQTRSRAINTAGGLKNMLEINPEQAIAYWEQNLATDPTFKGLADNFAAGDIDGAINEIAMGVTAAGGQDAYEALFSTPEPTAFMQELQAAGIEAGSEEFKQAVKERYGKGQTIGFDVIEAVNPDTGKPEFYQVSRVDPNVMIPTGLGVPTPESVLAKQAEQETATMEAAQQEMQTIDRGLSTVNQILSSAGLSDVSGMSSWIGKVPGTAARDVRAKVEQLKSQNFLQNISAMKGMGALSNAEGEKVSAATAALDYGMSDAAFRRELETIKQNLETAKQRLNSGQLVNPDGSPRAGAQTNQQPAQQGGDVVRWEDL